MTDKPQTSIHIDPVVTKAQLRNREPLLGICPKCNVRTEQGFGLAGGGYGVYVYCATDGCDYFAKHQLDHEP